VILINLLPHRELARQHQRQRFYRQLSGSVLLGVGLCAVMVVVYQQATLRQQARNQLLEAAIAELQQDIQEKVRLEKALAGLQTRRQVFEQLQGERNRPVHLLQELVLQLPDGVALSSLQQDRQQVVITGTAQSQGRVSELMHNLGSSDWFEHPELVEMSATPLHPGPAAVGSVREARRAVGFTIRLSQGRTTAAGGASVLARGE
jgi:type IV pilus assembly protein PilN